VVPDDLPLSSRLDEAPPILRGCTSSEVLALAFIGTAVWLPCGFLLAILVGMPPMGFAFATLGIAATVWGGATAFQYLKHARPYGHYQHRFHILLHELGLKRSPFIYREGTWDIGRTQR